VSTHSRAELIDITDRISNIVTESKVRDGICYVFVPHTTCGLTINENADPSVRQDIIKELGKVIPLSDNYRHMEGNSDAHIKSSLVGFSHVAFIENGNLVLGTWQGIYICEFDGPRQRKVIVKIVGD